MKLTTIAIINNDDNHKNDKISIKYINSSQFFHFYRYRQILMTFNRLLIFAMSCVDFVICTMATPWLLLQVYLGPKGLNALEIFCHFSGMKH